MTKLNMVKIELPSSFTDICQADLTKDFDDVFYKLLQATPRSEVIEKLLRYPTEVPLDDEVKVKSIPGHFWQSPVLGPREQDDVIMLIGERPGFDETCYCRNFVGPTGRLLYKVITDSGFSSEDIDNMYVCNVCRWTLAGQKSQNIPKKWLYANLLLLLYEIKILKPRHILCMGDMTIKTLLGNNFKISKMLGRPVVATFYDLSKNNSFCSEVFGCNNPAALFRNYAYIEPFKHTIKSLYRSVKGDYYDVSKVSNVTFKILDTKAELEKYVSSLKQSDELLKIAVDLEWDGIFPTADGAFIRTIQLSHKPGKAAIIPIYTETGQFQYTELSIEYISHMLNKLFSGNVQIIGHFLPADIPWLQSIGVDLLKLKSVPENFEDFVGGDYPGLFDTALAAHAFDETSNFDLETLAICKLGVRRWSTACHDYIEDYCKRNKISRKDMTGYGPIPANILYPYGAKDVAYTRALRDYYCKNLHHDKYGNDCWRPFHISMKAFRSFAEMHSRGLTVDSNIVTTLINIFEPAYNEKLEELRNELSWPDFNPNSPIQCAYALFGPKYVQRKASYPLASQNLKPVKATGRNASSWDDKYIGSKNPSTDLETCGILAARGNKAAGLLRDVKIIGQVFKNLLPNSNSNTNELGILKWVCEDGKVHSTFSPVKETGRASSSRPPLQNISKKRESDYARILGDSYKYPLRSILAAEDGYLLVEADLVAAELFVLAALSGDKVLLDHCLRSTLPDDNPNFYDIHSNIAVAAFGLDCAPTKEGLASIGKLDLRVAAKSIVYGTSYGRGTASCQREVQESGASVTLEEVEKLLNTFTSMYSMAHAFLQNAGARGISPGWLCNPFGRYRRFYYKGDDSQLLESIRREAMNYMMQSTVADSVNLLLYEIYKYREENNLDYSIVLQQHDSVVLQVREDLVEKIMTEVLPQCMNKVYFNRCDFDGKQIGLEKYYFGLDQSVYKNWGYKLTEEQKKKCNITSFVIGGKVE